MTFAHEKMRNVTNASAQQRHVLPNAPQKSAPRRGRGEPAHGITPGAIVLANGRVFRVDGLDSLTTVRAYDLVTGEAVTLPLHQLESPPRQRSSNEPVLFAEEEWERGAALAAAFAPYLEISRLPGAVTLGLATQLGVKPRQVQRAFARFREEPIASAMVRRPGGRPIGFKILDRRVERVIAHVYARRYAKRERISQEELITRVRSICRRLELPPPNSKTIQRRLREAAGYELDRARDGGKAAKQRWEPRAGRLPAMRALELVQIDHTLVDLLVLSDDRASVLGRPWLTVAIDVANRVVLGLYLTMNAPSAVSVARCIEHAVLPKKENAWRSELWPMHGLMEVVHADNAKELKSLALKRGCQEHGIRIEWRPLGKVHYGAHIERLMGTLMRLVHGLPGTTFSNVQERKDYPSDKRATMTLAELRVWLTLKICLRYHTRRHSALGMAPQLSWERAWQGEGKMCSPRLPARAEVFCMDFLPLANRRLQRIGVQFNCSRYWHDDLTPLVGPDAWALVRHNPDDPSRIWIAGPNGSYIEAAAVAGRAAGDALAAASADEQRHMDQLTDFGFALCDELEASAARETRKLRKTLLGAVDSEPRMRGKRGGRRKTTSAPEPAAPSPAIPATTGKLPVEEWS